MDKKIKTNNKCVIFARVSSREQSEEGFSLDAQVRNLKEFAQRKDFKIVKIFAVPESAKSSEERKTFQALIVYVQKHNINIILCEKVDRITRNFKDAVAIDDWLDENEARQVVFTRDGIALNKNSRSNDKLNWGVRILFAKNYIDQLKENVRGGYKEKAEQGWYPNGKKRGYESVRPDGQKRAIWQQDKSPTSELPFIKKACELYAMQDLSLKELSRRMFEQGWKQKDGKPIAKSTMAKVIQDPFYCGWFEWKGGLYKDAKHEGIITPEIHQIILDKLNRKHHPKYRTHLRLFKNMMTCGECGGVITSELQKGHVYYHCTRYKPCEQRKFTREEVVEGQILDELDKLQIKNKKMLNWLIKALKESHQDEIKYHNDTLANLNSQYSRIQQRLDNLYLDKLDGRVSVKKYDELADRFRQEQEGAREQIVVHEQANKKYFELGVNLLEVAKNAKKIYLSRSIDEKRQLLNLVFSNLTLENGNLLILKQKPFQLIAERAKNNNWSG